MLILIGSVGYSAELKLLQINSTCVVERLPARGALDHFDMEIKKQKRMANTNSNGKITQM